MSAAPSGTGGRPRSSRSSGHTKGPAAHLGPPPSFRQFSPAAAGAVPKQIPFYGTREGERGTLGRRSRATQRAFSNWRRRRRRRCVWRCNASIRHPSEGRRQTDKQLPTRRSGRDELPVMRKDEMKFLMRRHGQVAYNPSPTLSFIDQDAHRPLGQAFLC